ncbi:transcriptional activator NhaR [Colwellia sp. C1TZA3]|uniref:transcriptional activator NhaR n=1 Tax=Colwellia sp. C1TZA3 TaxID=2508879 RepID=UPI0011BA0F6F|nr:transcriptional activator NhaR [Colwellia sp. C1TZA3]TWX73455.1 transcriptional activator NhaR [Colwellia sp. C1TZA3]
MSPLNYNHLFYFYVVATEGTISKASARLNLTSQTISGQITSFETQVGVNLFDRKGKKLYVSEMGQLIYSYAEEIFQLGDEIKHILKRQQPVLWHTFTVGITNVIPKVLAQKLLSPVLNMNERVRLICIEGDQNSLLADLAVNKLDCILTDQPLQLGNHVKAYNHLLVESSSTFFAAETLLQSTTGNFPQYLSELPWLMQSKKSEVRGRLSSWLEKQNISPNIVAEFDDSALMKTFGEAGYGVFTSPTLIEEYVVDKYDVNIIGRTDEIKEHYYIISPERRLKHPAILEIVTAVKK